MGKTAVIEGLAQAIAAGDVPPSLKEVRLLSLDVGALLAGASMKGEFEARLKGVLEEAARSPHPSSCSSTRCIHWSAPVGRRGQAMRPTCSSLSWRAAHHRSDHLERVQAPY